MSINNHQTSEPTENILDTASRKMSEQSESVQPEVDTWGMEKLDEALQNPVAKALPVLGNDPALPVWNTDAPFNTIRDYLKEQDLSLSAINVVRFGTDLEDWTNNVLQVCVDLGPQWEPPRMTAEEYTRIGREILGKFLPDMPGWKSSLEECTSSSGEGEKGRSKRFEISVDVRTQEWKRCSGKEGTFERLRQNPSIGMMIESTEYPSLGHYGSICLFLDLEFDEPASGGKRKQVCALTADHIFKRKKYGNDDCKCEEAKLRGKTNSMKVP